MRIEQLKINGISKSIGYQMPYAMLSFKILDAKGLKAVLTRVEVSTDSSFDNIIYEVEREDQCSEGIKLEITLEARTIYYVRVRVTDDTGDQGQASTSFETGKMDEEWCAKWIGMDAEDTYHPVFSKSFDLEKKGQGRLYIAGLGLYEVYLNGNKVGDEYLTPYFNDYKEHVQVQTYDISDFLADHNRVEVYLGNGWYKGAFGMAGMKEFDAFRLIAEIHVTDENGLEQIIASDDTWTYSASGVVDSGIYAGEILDDGIKPENCKKTVVLPEDNRLGKLTDRYSLPVVKKQVLDVIEVVNTPAGGCVLDFGQNMAGWVVFNSHMKAGQTIHLEFGEVLQQGNFYNDNYRSAAGGFTYTSDGSQKWVRPHFTYFGFRYVKVSGIDHVDPADFKAWVLYSDLDDTGSFTTDHVLLNRLYENCVWGQRSNFLDIPSDCPQRDERLAWTGDAEIFAPTATYNMDTKAFYRKFLWMMRTAQKHKDGGIPAYVPEGFILCDPAAGWGDAATIIPQVLYDFYNDPEILKESYPMMKDWVDYVGRAIEKIHGSKTGLWSEGFQFGDWLALDGFSEMEFKGSTPDTYMASMYYYHSLCLLAKAAKLLEIPECQVYETLAEEERQVLLDEYFSPNGHLSVNTQTAYVIALNFDVYRDREVLIQDFMQQLRREKFKIRGGFAGAPVLCQTLAKCGRADLAYHFLFNEDYPGWFNEVKLGATTVWERWNSILPDGSMNPSGMNSLNHYGYGSVCEFMYKYMAGIQPGDNGFRDAVIAPEIYPKIRSLAASYDSPAGLYKVSWKLIEDGSVYIKVAVPFGCNATLRLPYEQGREIQLGAGVYENTYKPEKNPLCIYGPEAFLTDVFANEAASQLVMSKLPMAGMFMSPDNSFRQVKDLFELIPMGADPNVIFAVAGQLEHMPC